MRTRTIEARLPRYQAEMLDCLAERQETSVGHLLSTQLDELASEHLHELSTAIADFSEAFVWPSGEEIGTRH